MRKIFVFATLLLMVACSQPTTNQKKELLNQIKNLEDSLFQSKDLAIDIKKANRMLGLYQDYSSSNLDDSISAVMLFKSAEIAMNIQKGPYAISALDTLLKHFPNHAIIPQALHLKGFIYDDLMGSPEMARISFEKLVHDYPNHKLAQNAKEYMKLLGKTPEEIIKSFEEKNKDSMP